MKISKKLTLTLFFIAIIPIVIIYFFISYTAGNIIEEKIINEYEAEQQKKKFLELGADAFILKPLMVDEIRMVIKEVLT